MVETFCMEISPRNLWYCHLGMALNAVSKESFVVVSEIFSEYSRLEYMSSDLHSLCIHQDF